MAKYDVTHARVKFIDDNCIKTIEIEKIVEFQANPPTSVLDFDKKKIYNAVWTDDKNPKEILLPIIISDMIGKY